MTGARFSFALLEKQDRAGFHSGVEALDRYFRTQASQDVRRGACVCYIALERASGAIVGFYTLCAADIPVTEIDAALIRKFPRYPTVPAARIGRLAIDRRFQGMGLGQSLLADATARAVDSGIGVYAMIVDAKDASAAAFYHHHGFVSYGSSANTLMAPIKTLLAR